MIRQLTRLPRSTIRILSGIGVLAFFIAAAQAQHGVPERVSSAISSKYLAYSSILGTPIRPIRSIENGTGYYQVYTSGSIYWTERFGAHELHGEIWKKYNSAGGFDLLGYPITDVVATVDGVGQQCTCERGVIFWTAQTGAHEVHGAILQKWANLGWERSYLGYPSTDELVTPNLSIDGTAQGRYSLFQHGRIIWTPSSGAIDVPDLAEVWEAQQKKDFRASSTGTRKVLTIIYNTYTAAIDTNPQCAAPAGSNLCTSPMPVPSVADIQSVLFGTRPNAPPPKPTLPKANIADYFRENSGPPLSSAPAGRLKLENAGILSIDAPQAKRGAHYWLNHTAVDAKYRDGWLDGHQERDHDAITLAYTEKAFPFAAYDTNHDLILTSDELAIIVVCASLGDEGFVRRAVGGYKTFATTSGYELKVGGVDDSVVIKSPNGSDIIEWFTHPASASRPILLGLPAHELGHLLIGIPDLYNVTSASYAGSFSMMSALPSASYSSHFDPFVKLKAKWMDYGVIAGSGRQIYTLRNIEQYGEALVLYDGSRGRDEYYILEYRRPGDSYDAGRAGGVASGIPAAGLAVWHVIENPTSHALNVPAGASNWYDKGVRLVRADPATPLKDAKALFTPSSAAIYLKWSDGTDTGFKIVVETEWLFNRHSGGSPGPLPHGETPQIESVPVSLRLTVTR